jgi:PTH1 family peptidyl-tRNA hydrolase
MTASIRLIVGLGNPGTEYQKTRHNAGTWFVENLFSSQFNELKLSKRFHGLFGQLTLKDNTYYVLIPNTYMNNSGLAVVSVVNFYKLSIDSILIAHDELDLPVGTVRFKYNGGHAGHKGLQNIISRLGGQKNFYRVRIGIGRPSPSQTHLSVEDYVLKPPRPEESVKIHRAIQIAITCLDQGLVGDWQNAIQKLHSNST